MHMQLEQYKLKMSDLLVSCAHPVYGFVKSKIGLLTVNFKSPTGPRIIVGGRTVVIDWDFTADFKLDVLAILTTFQTEFWNKWYIIWKP